MSDVVCAIFDKAVGAFGKPLFFRAKGEAVRSFMTECQNKESQLYAHPGDFALMYLGQFDDATGVFSQPQGGPTTLLQALEAHTRES